MNFRLLLTSALLCSGVVTAPAAEDRKALVLNDRVKVSQLSNWIYNDLPKAFEEARRTGKPMLVLMRCVPCVACRGFDEQVVGRDPKVQELMDKFVCVRVVQANGLDLNLFQYDFDLSFSLIFMNADRTVYGRFGTRSEVKNTEKDISLDGLAEALKGALVVHQQYPANKALLVGKQPLPPRFSTPEQYPALKEKYKASLDYEGKLVESCIHCHMVAEAERKFYREKGEPIPDTVLFPFPMPDVLGITIDPQTKAHILSVGKDSVAERDGFKAGDVISTLGSQPILSLADIQWVLHTTPAPAKLKAEVLREGKPKTLTLTLAEGWRRASDISWRPTSWDLRRMAFGGMRMEDVPVEGRARYGVTADALALRITNVGQFGEHAKAKQAGFLKDDVLVAMDGRKTRMTETELFAYIVQTKPKGVPIPVEVLRGGQRVALQMPNQ